MSNEKVRKSSSPAESAVSGHPCKVQNQGKFYLLHGMVRDGETAVFSVGVRRKVTPALDAVNFNGK